MTKWFMTGPTIARVFIVSSMSKWVLESLLLLNALLNLKLTVACTEGIRLSDLS